MNLSKIQQKLAEFEAKNTKKPASDGTNQSNFWKPKPGENTIRILPNPSDPDYPYVDLAFYYFNGKTYLAPSALGHSDPAVEVYNNFMPKDKNGTLIKLPLEEWKPLAKAREKFKPLEKHFLLVLVRGEEAEGPKWWGHTAKVWNEILSTIFADEDWGDVTDFTKGRDIKVTYTVPKTEGEFPSTKVLPKANISVASDDLEKLKAQIKEVPALTTIFKEPTYDELKAAIEQHMKVAQSGDDGAAKPEQPKVQPKEEPVKTEEVEKVESSFADILANIEMP